MAYEHIQTQRDDAVLTIRLHRPDALNALIPPMLEELIEAFHAAEAEDGPTVIVLEGAGRAFCAGVDLKVLSTAKPKAGRVGPIFDEPASRLMQAVRASTKPVIAKVHGACFTGALEFVLHCDFIHATDDAKFGDTHAKFAIRPTWGMSQTLVDAVGARRAKELSYSARTFSGREAALWGLVNTAYDSKQALDSGVAELAAEIASNDPATLRAYKTLHAIAETHSVPAGIAAETAADFPEITSTLDRIGGFLKVVK